MKNKKHNRTSIVTGATGEHYVAAELSKRGYIVSLTPRNTHTVDILASSIDGTKTISIQVKTRSDCIKKWTLSPKEEEVSGTKFFYIFVNLMNDEYYPEFHIVRSKVVVEYIKNSHDNWRKRNGENRHSKMRFFLMKSVNI